MQHEYHRVPVTALASFRADVILTGEGNYLKAYSKNSQLLSCIRIFQDQAIHGIVTDENNVSIAFVYGGRFFRNVCIGDGNNGKIHITLGPVQIAGDWILDACFGPSIEVSSRRCLTVVTAHNALYRVILDDQSKEGFVGQYAASIECIVPRSNSILYSAHIHWLSPSQCLVASGTAFGDIIVWSAFLPSELRCSSTRTETHYTFSAHEGSIFGVRISPLVTLPGSEKKTRLLATCSDDRNIKLWDVSDLSTGSPTLAEKQRVTGFGASDEKQDIAPMSLARVMGHVSRIWQVRFVINSDDRLQHVRSFGEDASVITWKLNKMPSQPTFALEKIKVITAHSGKNIWSIASNASGRFATGGADGAIALYSSTASITHSLQTLDMQVNGSMNKDGLRAYAFIDTNLLVATTEHGGIVEIQLRSDVVTDAMIPLAHPMNSLRGFSMVATAHGVAFFAGAKGDLYAHVKGSAEVEHISHCDRKPAGVFTSQTGRETALLITTVGSTNMRLILFNLNCNAQELRIVQEIILDLPTGFIVTSFALQAMHFSKHAIIGSRTGSIAIFDLERRSDSVSLEPDQVHHIAHGKEAVTHLQTFVKEGETDQYWLFSCGRDGTFGVHRISFRDNTYEIQLAHQLSLPFGPNIEGMSLRKNGKMLIWGFKGTNFIAYDAIAQRETMSVECGGAHRNWAFQPSEAGGTFIWTKASQVYRTTQTVLPYELLNFGGHGREIKPVAVSPSVPEIIATGAEDTDIKLHTYEHGRFKCLQTLRKHNTGIQCLKWSQDGSYLFSSGGFEEFYAWKISLGIPYIEVGVVCESKHPQSGMSDLRIMGFDLHEVSKCRSQSFKILMTYSDSTARQWNYSANSWDLLASGDYLTSCLTHAIWTSEAGCDFLTTATDGHLVQWQVNESRQSLSWSVRRKVHQSAIHVTTPRKLVDGTSIVVTGGDDNAIAITRFASTSDTAGARTVVIPKAHAAAVTGIVVVPVTETAYWIISASIDQRLKLWQMDIDHEQPGIDGFNVKLLQNVFTAVADVSSLDVCALEDGALGVLVSGVGMDVWRLPPSSEN